MLSRGALPKDEPEEPFKATAAGHTLEAHYSIIFHSTINAPRDATKTFSMSRTKQASRFSFLCFFFFFFFFHWQFKLFWRAAKSTGSYELEFLTFLKEPMK